MKILLHKYYLKDAKIVSFHLKSLGIKNEIVGGISDKGHSNKDIDIYFPELDDSADSIMKVGKALGVSFETSSLDGTRTEVGGFYFYRTLFGDIDCFFSKQTKEYCEKFWKENT